MIWRPTWDYAWNSGAKVAASRDADGWTVELAVPVEGLGLKRIVPGTTLGMNFGRTQPRRRDAHNTCWSRTLKTFHEPQRFGHVVLGQARCQVQDISLGTVGQGRNLLCLQVANHTGADRHVRAEIAVSQQAGPSRHRTVDARISPKGLTKVQVPYDLDAGRGAMALQVAVRDAVDGAYYLDTHFRRRLQDPLEARLQLPVCFTSDQTVQLNAFLHVGEVTLHGAGIVVRLKDRAGVVREGKVRPLDAARAALYLNIRGLSPGRYELELDLVDREGSPIATVPLPFWLVASPLPR